jgi:hypothetical protein
VQLVGFLLFVFTTGMWQPCVLAAPPCLSPDTIHSDQTWSLNFDSSVPHEYRAAISRAFQTWELHLAGEDLIFSKTFDHHCLTFRFVSGDHGDGFPFQERGIKVSHVVSLPLDRSLPEVHMNSTVDWRVNGADPDVYTVALHEIGHALGFSHSIDTRSIMYPLYGKERLIIPSELLKLSTRETKGETPGASHR